MSALTRVATGAVVLCIVGVGWLGAAEPFTTYEQGLECLRAMVAVGLLFGAAFGAGRLTRRGARPGAQWLHDLAAGSVLLCALCGVLLPLGLASAPLLAIGATALAAAGWRPGRAPVLGLHGALVGAAVLACLLPLLPVAFAPPIDTDELYWQLAVPAQIVREGGLPGGWLEPVASRPLSVQLLYGALLVGGGELAPRVAHIMATALLAVGIFDVARRAFGPVAGVVAGLMAIGNWTLLDEAPLAHDNVPAALMVLAALDGALHRRPYRWALASGAALSVKYTAAPAVLAVGVVAYATMVGPGANPRRWARVGLRYAGLTALALLLVAPWWLRNALDGLHPFFPYAGWPEAGGFVYAYPAKYGAGRGFVDWLSLPWNLVMKAETGSFVFLGRVHALWLLFLPVSLYGAWREPRVRWLLLASVVGCTAWFALGAQWMRHLVPLVPLLAVTLAAGACTLPIGVLRGMGLAWLLLLLPQTADRWATAGDSLAVARGLESRDEYYAREHLGHATAHFVNTNLPTDAVVALLFTSESYLYERAVRLGSVEDHTPSRLLMVQYGDRAVDHLREAGVTHVVARRVNILAKSYPFLPPAAFEEQFTKPQALLHELLPLKATLLFEDRRYGVWALDDPSP